MSAGERGPDDRRRLSDLFAAHGAELLAYARRRGAGEADAEDVVAETFVTAWRRLDQLPHDAARAWLFGVARRVLANQRRGHARRDRHLAALVTDPPTRAAPIGLDADLAAALGELRPDDREVLLLAAWEGMEPAEIAVVLGISANAAAIRAHRARRRFAAAMELKGSRWVRTYRWVKGSRAREGQEVNP